MKTNKYKAFSSTLKGLSAKYSEKNVARGLGPVPAGTGPGHSPTLLPDDDGLAEILPGPTHQCFQREPRGPPWWVCAEKAPEDDGTHTGALPTPSQKTSSRMFPALALLCASDQQLFTCDMKLLK